jgi:hypothetical protein
MGNAESSDAGGGAAVGAASTAEGAAHQAEVEIDGSKLGYRVLDVEENGPAACCGLALYVDFITHVNGVRLDTEDSPLLELVTQNEGKSLHLTVYNCKRKALREVSFVPSRGWGGVGLLGLMVRFDSYEGFDQSVIRVLNVYPGSPAEEAGLTQSVDFLLGTPEIIFLDLDDLFDIVKMSTGRKIQMYVYSLASDTVRLTVIKPRHNWGGEGVLGCDVGQGYLHCLPTNSTLTEGRTDRGEHLQKVCQPQFLRACGRSVPVSTPLGDGDCVLPFPGTEERVAPSGKKVVLLDWGFAPGEGLDVSALMDRDEVTEREVEERDEVDENIEGYDEDDDDDDSAPPELPPKPSSMQPEDPDEPPMPPPKPKGLASMSASPDTDAGAGEASADGGDLAVATSDAVTAVDAEDTSVAATADASVDAEETSAPAPADAADGDDSATTADPAAGTVQV